MDSDAELHRMRMAVEGWRAWHGSVTAGPMGDPMQRATFVGYATALREVHQLLMELMAQAPHNKTIESIVYMLVLRAQQHGIDPNIVRGIYPLVVDDVKGGDRSKSKDVYEEDLLYGADVD